jgi:hypothetical protein
MVLNATLLGRVAGEERTSEEGGVVRRQPHNANRSPFSFLAVALAEAFDFG